MKAIYKQWKLQTAALVSAALLLFSCNKDLPVPQPIVPAPPTGQSVMDIVNGNPNFSFLKAAIDRAGFATVLGTATNVYTVFAPDNAAFQLSGIPSIDAINALPVATLQSILNYHLIGGLRMGAANISERFPNNQLQSMLIVAPPSTALPPGYRMPLGISRRGSNAWANQIPVKQADIQASNGVIHVVAGMIAPPTTTLAQLVSTDASYSYLLAAINRADSGVAAPNRLVDALGNALANFTVMAPTDEAFRNTLTFVITQALIAQGMDPATALATATTLASTPAVFQNPALFGALTAQTVRGIVAYHVIGRVSANPANTSLVGRIFSVNIPAGTTNVNTLVIPAPNVGPVPVAVTNTSGVITVRGLGNPAPASVVNANIHCINGVIHRINGVLLPQ